MTEQFFSVLDSITEEELSKEQRVNDSLSEAQKFIGFGTKVFLLTPSMVEAPLVVGHILPPAEWPTLRNMSVMKMMQEEPNDLPGSDEEERELFSQGWRRGMFYSRYHPMGYVAKYHISRLYPLTETEFENIRKADQMPDRVVSEPWFTELEQNIVAAIERIPGAPYRKLCPKCASGRVLVAEYYDGVTFAPIALEPTPGATALTVRTGDAIKDTTLQVHKRCFHCVSCKWESEPLNEEEYPEFHACGAHASQVEALFRLEDFVI